MKKKRSAKVILIFLIILFFCLLCFLIILQSNLKKQTIENSVSRNSTVNENPKSVEDVIIKYNSEYIKQEENKIYVKFSKDLYSEDGSSNEKFFNDLIEEIIPFFDSKSFYLIDEEKTIEIYIKFNYQAQEHEIYINKIKEFYEQTDGVGYSKVETSKIVKPSALYVSNGYLERLVPRQMFLSSIEEYLDEGKDLENGYRSYNDNTIRLKLLPNRSVLNIIFSDSYGYSILSDVDANTPLSKVYELHNDNTFGSLDKGYLGYRSNDLYYFFYEDEVSVYGYAYRRNETFEDALEQYILDKDLEKFIIGLSKDMLSYDTLEYDFDIKSATMIFPTRGIEIKIRDNDPKGITLYSNYYFTDKTKMLVKNGLISYSTQDLVEKYELARREANT